MSLTSQHRVVGRLLSDFRSGRISRRDLLRGAAAAGLSATAFAALSRATAFRTSAQDATPGAVAPGSTIVVPTGLRTDLTGQSIKAVLGDSTSPDTAWTEAAIAIFTETTGITVEFVRGETQADARLQSYRQQWAAESDENDVYMVDVIWPGVVAAHAIDLNESLSDLAALHFPAIVENNTVDGVLVGVPWFTDAGLLYFRTDLLEKYSLTPPATWAELTTSAQTIQDGERATNESFTGFVFQGNAYEGLTCNGLEWQLSNGGGSIVEPDGAVSINNPQAIAAFERATGWVGTISPQDVTTYIESDALNVWVAGNAAFMRNWPYAFAASQDTANSAVAGMIDVQPLPMGDGENARNADTLGGWQLMVSRYSTKQEAGIEFVRFMCSAEVQASFAIERAHLPTIASVYDDPAVAAASEFIPRLKDVFQGGAAARPSSVTGDLYPEISAIYSSQLNAVLTGANSAADAVASMEEDITASLSGE